MPRNTEINKILVIGAGPIMIGQGCEFDYSGTQACRALKEEGCEVILVNSNPATIMTDPDMADHIYIEPIHIDILNKVIKKHRPEALLPTLGGQTALNMTLELHYADILKKNNIQVIGLQIPSIEIAENRQLFKAMVTKLGLEVPKSITVSSFEEVKKAKSELGFPLIIRTSFTLGGEGGGIAYDNNDLDCLCANAFQFSKSLLIEESVIGWKEYELELIRDNTGNAIVVCGIENLDPMGVHTGDSITVAPIQTLTDKEYQKMRIAAFDIMEAVGMTSGGCNVQFAIHPKSGKMLCIEINPRVSRSSALASKATGFPIARIATKIALGFNLYELQNELIENTFPCSFEPTIDYVVTKIPYFNFDKFPNADDKLTTHMKSVGEVMGIGRTFQESILKAIDSLESPTFPSCSNSQTDKETRLSPHPNRLSSIFQEFRRGCSIEELHKKTGYDPWFLYQINDLILCEKKIKKSSINSLKRENLLGWKKKGFSDQYLAPLIGCTKEEILELRWKLNIHPVYKRIDSCAAEFPNRTAYMYSTYEEECESEVSINKKIVIIGSGANRIGQGIEFDYCCVHSVKAAKEQGYETIIINCNPETVSTDYDTADRLYLEPLSLEYVLEILRLESPEGVIIQMGGQTPLKIAHDLGKKGVKILGTSLDATEVAEDKDQLRFLLNKMKVRQPRNITFSTFKEAIDLAAKIGFPIILRPSFIIGGSLIEIVHSELELVNYLKKVNFEECAPFLMEEFLQDCIEVEVDAISDGQEVVCCGTIEHLDFAGIHSGDSVSFLSPYKISKDIQENLYRITKDVGLQLGIIGLFNIQFAIQNEKPIILEVNPRASRTIPLLSKITGYPFVRIATKCILSQSLKKQGISYVSNTKLKAMKLPIFPFSRLGNRKT